MNRMARRVVLQNTGMNSTKYGSFERYLVNVVMRCRERGYATIVQYESTPSSAAYVRDLAGAGAEIRILTSHDSPSRVVPTASRLVASVRPEVIHNHFVPPSWDAASLASGRLVGARTLVKTVHSHPGYVRQSRLRHIYGHYDHILAVSDAVRASLETGGVDPARLQTLYLGLFGERQASRDDRHALRRESGLPDDAPVIGCIAFDAPVKGVDLLLRALKVVHEWDRNVYLLQVGVSSSSQSLPGLARDLGVDDRVVWAGIVDSGWRLLSAVDVYVQPSRSEGLPFGVMEAMAMRLPIVCTNVSGNTEAVVNGLSGIVAQPDVRSLAAAIRGLLGHREQWKALGDAAWKRYRELFDGEASVYRLVTEIYQIPD